MSETLQDRLRRHREDLLKGGTNAGELRADLQLAADRLDGLAGLENLKWDKAARGKDRTVITLGYSGDPAKNRGLEQAVRLLKSKYPHAEIVTRRVDNAPDAGGILDAFHAKLGPVES